jgi:hypothetical protein
MKCPKCQLENPAVMLLLRLSNNITFTQSVPKYWKNWKPYWYKYVVLFIKFLTMTTTLCRNIEKFLIKHRLFPEAQR